MSLCRGEYRINYTFLIRRNKGVSRCRSMVFSGKTHRGAVDDVMQSRHISRNGSQNVDGAVRPGQRTGTDRRRAKKDTECVSRWPESDSPDCNLLWGIRFFVHVDRDGKVDLFAPDVCCAFLGKSVPQCVTRFCFGKGHFPTVAGYGNDECVQGGLRKEKSVRYGWYLLMIKYVCAVPIRKSSRVRITHRDNRYIITWAIVYDMQVPSSSQGNPFCSVGN